MAEPASPPPADERKGRGMISITYVDFDDNMMVDDLKKVLVRENPGHEVTFK